MPETIESAEVNSDEPADLALETEDACGEIRLHRVLNLPFPASQNGIALTAERTQQAVQHVKGKPQAAETGRAAVWEHGPVRRATPRSTSRQCPRR